MMDHKTLEALEKRESESSGSIFAPEDATLSFAFERRNRRILVLDLPEES
jgi:hypothetical protein